MPGFGPSGIRTHKSCDSGSPFLGCSCWCWAVAQGAGRIKLGILMGAKHNCTTKAACLHLRHKTFPCHQGRTAASHMGRETQKRVASSQKTLMSKFWGWDGGFKITYSKASIWHRQKEELDLDPALTNFKCLLSPSSTILKVRYTYIPMLQGWT